MAETSSYVFLSHSSADAADANWLTEHLEEGGIKVWIAPRDVRPGRDYAEQLHAAIEGCSAFIVLVSGDANESSFVRAETEMAFSQDRRIFPVRTQAVEPGPGLALFLKIKHWTNAYGLQRERALRQLVAEIQGGEAESESPQSADRERRRSSSRREFEEVDPDRLKRIIGPATPYYLNAWARMERRRTLLSWNWPAFFAGLAAPGAWPAYRKIWSLAWFLVPIDWLLTHTLHELGGGRLPLLVLFLPSAIEGALLGLFANAIYRSHVQSVVAMTQDEEDGRALAKRPVSWPGLILLVIIHTAIALVYLLMSLPVWS